MDALNQFIENFLNGYGWTAAALARLLLAAVLGGMIGMERELRGRQAGFRTNLLVCIGSALVMLVSVALARQPWTADGAYNINVDPGRIAYGVMTGIGFLGAGAIIKQDLGVRGLTTAAGLWCVAAVGLAAGLGLYILAVSAAALIFLGLWLLQSWESRIQKQRFRLLVIRCPWDPAILDTMLERLRGEGVSVSNRSFVRIGDLSEVELSLSVCFADEQHYKALERKLAQDTVCRLVSSVRA